MKKDLYKEDKDINQRDSTAYIFYRKRDILYSFQGTESNVIYPGMKDFLTDFIQKRQ